MEEYFVPLKMLIENAGYPAAIIAGSYFLSKILTPLTPAIIDWIKGRTQARDLSESGEIITLATIDERVRLLGSNHFHEIKDSLDRLERSVSSGFDNLNRKSDSINDSLSYLKGRIK